MPGTRFIDLVASHSRSEPEKLAVLDKHSRLTFGQVDRRASQFAAMLEELTSEPSSTRRVALLALNEAEFVEMQTGAMRAGVTLAPLNHRLPDSDLAYILNDCQPDLLIAGRSFEARATRLAEAANVSHLLHLGVPKRGRSYESALAAFSANFRPTNVDPSEPCLLMYTSGTTGRPKGALFDRQAMTARMLVNTIELKVRQDAVFLQSLPMFHVSGLLGYAHTFGGATMLLLESFDADQYLNLIAEWGVTTTALVPTTLSMLLDAQESRPRDLSSLNLLIYGGSSIDPELLARAMSSIPVSYHQQYGMTETMGGLSILRPEDHDPDDPEVLRSAGSPAITYSVEILSDADTAAADGEVGEIACAGPALMSGYLNLPEVTAATMREGWLRTGDIGFRDKRGYIHVVDRKNSMIITGGENVFPREVEEAILAHPAVFDVAVIGLADPKWGERIVAVLPNGGPSDEELDLHVRRFLAGYKVPKDWFRVDKLPRNATGKLVRPEIRRMIEEPAPHRE